MRILLGGHLNFYHPKKEKWLEVHLGKPVPLVELLDNLGIPLGEVHLVILNGEMIDLHEASVSDHDRVKLYSAVGGG